MCGEREIIDPLGADFENQRGRGGRKGISVSADSASVLPFLDRNEAKALPARLPAVVYQQRGLLSDSRTLGGLGCRFRRAKSVDSDLGSDSDANPRQLAVKNSDYGLGGLMLLK